MLVGAAALVLTWLLRALDRWRARRRGRRLARRGHEAEGRAAKRLAQLGFRNIVSHPELRFTWWVDGLEEEGVLRADFLAERGGRLFAVEVKTGRGRDPRHGPTRRQLLEYALHYGVDSVLLFDEERDHLYEVRFPLAGPAPEPSRLRWFLLGLVGGVGVALALLR